MLTLFSDVSSPFSGFSRIDELRRRMDRLFDQLDAEQDGRPASLPGPRFSLHDAGNSLLVTADVPGMTDKDFELTLEQNTLQIRGSRKIKEPEGYGAHRRERESFEFARSFALPCKVDPEATVATVKDGVLTVCLAKSPEAKPRQIAVKAQ